MKCKHRLRVFIVIPATEMGGTQKRLIALWEFMQTQGHCPITLVVTRSLYGILSTQPLYPHLREDNNRLIIVNARRFRFMVLPLIHLAIHAGRGAVFHYPLSSIQFFHTLLGQRVVRSIPMNDLSILLPRHGHLLRYLQLIRARRIDILNPRVVAQVNAHWLLGLFLKKKVHLTKGNSISVAEDFAVERKKNWIVFLGRFTDQAGDLKNVIPLVQSLPKIYRVVTQAGIEDPVFFILGYGPLEPEINRMLSLPGWKSLPVRCYYEKEPQKVLLLSKVFLSLQKFSNYPSRSLLEAVACGNLPVITDVGESRLLADESFAEFIPGSFTPGQLAQAVFAILSLTPSAFKQKTQRAARFLQDHFSITAHADYYSRLYEGAAYD